MHSVDFPTSFARETTFMASCLVSCIHKTLSEKGSTLKGKNLLPVAANSFLLG